MSSSAEAPWPKVDDSARCPCLSGATYGACCGPFHRGEALAPSAERLMRSRYSAYVTGNVRYLLATWHPTTKPRTLELDPGQRWILLDITHTSRGGMLDDIGTVEFTAKYRSNGRAGEQHENSRFVRERRRWYYVDAI
jgi:SEC-C motif-containing protein